MIELIGYIGALAYALSGLPFAIETYRKGSTDASLTGVILILVGGLGMLGYEALTSAKVPSLLNFALCTAAWAVVLKFKLLPRRKV